MTGALDGRGVIITGASRGLGEAVARACVAEGAHVVLCARGPAGLEAAAGRVAAAARPGQVVFAQAADVSRPDDVRRLVGAAVERLPSLDGLVNNAAVQGPIGPLETTAPEDWRRTVEVNLLGAYLVCRAVAPVFKRQGRGKIVNLAGGGATGPRPNFSAYAASKAAVVRLTETLAEETRAFGVDVNAVAPGALNTRMLDEVLAAGPEAAGQTAFERARAQKQSGGAPLEQAAELCVFLLSAASDGLTGRLISAVWDPWPKLTDRRAELEHTDVYTLRRITPADRGLDWG